MITKKVGMKYPFWIALAICFAAFLVAAFLFVRGTRQPSPVTNPTTAQSQPTTPSAPPKNENIPTGWKMYRSDRYGFEISSPATTMITLESDAYQPASWIGNGVTEIDFPLGAYAGTNLQQALVMVSATSGRDMLALCETSVPTYINQPLTKVATINGITFHMGEFTDAGMGNYYASTIYRTIHAGTCYEINLFLHSTYVGNYTPGTIKEFDKPSIMRQLESVLATFQFKK